MRGDTLSVIAGIVENFHFETLREDMRPVIIRKAGFWREDEYLLVRSEPGNTRAVRAAVELVWSEVMPAATFDATYMDQKFNAMHVSEYKQRTLLLILAGLTLLVSCIGLIGLVAYVVALAATTSQAYRAATTDVVSTRRDA